MTKTIVIAAVTSVAVLTLAVMIDKNAKKKGKKGIF